MDEYRNQQCHGRGEPAYTGPEPPGEQPGGPGYRAPTPPPTGVSEYRDRSGYRESGAPPPPGTGMSRRGKVILVIGVALFVLGGLFAAALIVDRVLFPPKKGRDFVLESSNAYQDALFDIRRYYYKPFSEEKIAGSADQAVEKAKDKGVTDPDELLNAGLSALVKGLGDEHSGYLTPNENKRLSEDLSGSFFGVGFTLRSDKDADRPKVVTIIGGSPADRAGVKPNDVIKAVDGEDTRGEPLDAVVLRIRGRKGTRVKIEIMRDGKPLEFNITREKIDIPDFESELVDGNIGIIRLFEFNDGVSGKVRAAVREMQQKGAQGFILDLRNNPGGLLEEAVRVTSVFVNDGPVVSYKTKGDKETAEYAKGGAETTLPLVVLVNDGSASSSEITAGALKDRGRATLVGSKTYGKGSVQKVFRLANRGAAKLTIALYYLPNGESIDGKGIQPDVAVRETKDDHERTEKDQLDRAKQVLGDMIQGRPPAGEALRPAA